MADAGLGVVDKLEAGDVRPTFPQIGQVNVQETLKQKVDVRRGELRHRKSVTCMCLLWFHNTARSSQKSI